MDVLEASYDSVDEVDEDAELELSCALQDLTTRCKSFSAKMTDDLPEIDDGEVSEDEDLPRFFAADAKAGGGSRRPRGDKGGADDDPDDGDEFYNQTHEELTSIQSNIKHLLEKLESAAAKQTSSSDRLDDETTNGRSGTTNQRQEK